MNYMLFPNKPENMIKKVQSIKRKWYKEPLKKVLISNFLTLSNLIFSIKQRQLKYEKFETNLR